ncbi:hypothetical protein GQ42DRAFT_155301 [Ramicandelaber brevisporus]|nr:hypothetical protein GQ42DRAFT_155301 [Ramicandelaber brevisporus]
MAAALATQTPSINVHAAADEFGAIVDAKATSLAHAHIDVISEIYAAMVSRRATIKPADLEMAKVDFVVVIRSDFSLNSNQIKSEKTTPGLKVMRRGMALINFKHGIYGKYSTVAIKKSDIKNEDAMYVIDAAVLETSFIKSKISPDFLDLVCRLMLAVLFEPLPMVTAISLLPKNAKPMEKSSAGIILPFSSNNVHSLPPAKYDVDLIGYMTSPHFHAELNVALLMLLGETNTKAGGAITGKQKFDQLISNLLKPASVASVELCAHLRESGGSSVTAGTKRSAPEETVNHLEKANNNIKALHTTFRRVAAMALLHGFGLDFGIKEFGEREHGDSAGQKSFNQSLMEKTGMSSESWYERIIGNHSKHSSYMRQAILNNISTPMQANAKLHLGSDKLLGMIRDDIIGFVTIFVILVSDDKYSQSKISHAVDKVWQSKHFTSESTETDDNEDDLNKVIIAAFTLVKSIIGSAVFDEVVDHSSSSAKTNSKPGDTYLLARRVLLHLRASIIVGLRKGNGLGASYDCIDERIELGINSYDNIDAIFTMRESFGDNSVKQLWHHHPLLPHCLQNIESASLSMTGVNADILHEVKQAAKSAASELTDAEKKRDAAIKNLVKLQTQLKKKQINSAKPTLDSVESYTAAVDAAEEVVKTKAELKVAADAKKAAMSDAIAKDKASISEQSKLMKTVRVSNILKAQDRKVVKQ